MKIGKELVRDVRLLIKKIEVRHIDFQSTLKTLKENLNRNWKSAKTGAQGHFWVNFASPKLLRTGVRPVWIATKLICLDSADLTKSSGMRFVDFQTGCIFKKKLKRKLKIGQIICALRGTSRMEVPQRSNLWGVAQWKSRLNKVVITASKLTSKKYFQNGGTLTD